MLKIYGVPLSVHTRKVIVAAIAKNLSHEVIPVGPVIPGNPPPKWRQISPTGRIPALIDGNFVLFDSAAICAYLDRLQPDPAIYPKDARVYAQVLSLEQYAGTLFSSVVHPLFNEVFVHPKIRQIPTDQVRVDEVLSTAVPEIFGYLESVAPQEFLAGSMLTVADIAVASNLINYQYIGFELSRTKFPRLGAWCDRSLRHPAMMQALRKEQSFVDSMGLSRGFLEAVLID